MPSEFILHSSFRLLHPHSSRRQRVAFLFSYESEMACQAEALAKAGSGGGSRAHGVPHLRDSEARLNLIRPAINLVELELGFYAANLNMRTLAIGDVHGCHVALTRLLEQVGPRADDRMVFLGDYIDRGPASREVVETLLELSGKCAPVFLRGNHEAMILDAREDALKANVWQSYGGFEALISYRAEYNQNWATIIPDSHWKFFERTTRHFETEDHIFVHACLDAEADMDEQNDWLLYWESVDRLKPHKSGKRIVCGHSPQRSGQILDLGFALCIDTGAVNGGWLTCLDVNCGAWLQSNEKGETRRGSMAPPS